MIGEAPGEQINIQALDVLVRFRGLWDIFFRFRRVSSRTLNVCLSCHEHWISAEG